MNCILTRTARHAIGIFGTLEDEDGNFIAYTLEHSYMDQDAYVPKLAVGTYRCERHAPRHFPYETFELLDVPPFEGKCVDGILIHCGNFDQDSQGCILLGLKRSDSAVLESHAAFSKFMSLQQGVESFNLIVK